MAPKRPADGAQQSGADKKRSKLRASRNIPVASTSQGGRQGGSAARGNNGLPPTIDVDKFAQARTFEISAMQRAMKAAKEAGTQRAFQSLPRHLRRRAASHNIRRLPTRLRARARAEVPKDAAKPKKTTRKMLGSKKKLKGSEKRDNLLRRQRNKIWLETHIWHAKRMHMIQIWGHRLAEKPTEKAFRSSYRASVHGALVHDASYFQYVELSGSYARLSEILAEVCDKTVPLPSSKRYSNGTRECHTDLYTPGLCFPRGLIGPATFIWDVPASADPAIIRRVLVRLHPTINKQAFAVISKTAERLQSAASTSRVPIEDFAKVRAMDKELLTFEITGRRATEVVKAVLKPTARNDDETKQAWKKLSAAAGPASVPNGMIFGLEVYDPRLSFPPKLDKSAPRIDGNDLLAPSTEIASIPALWDSKTREALKQPHFSKKELDERRSKSLLPGVALAPLAQDDRIPLLLSQRSLTPPSPFSSTSAPPPPMHSWTLTLPAGWGLPFFQSLVFSSSRIGGLRERFQQSFESGSSSFPGDYPTTPAFHEWEARRESVEKGYWDRRPPAKRCNWVKTAEGTTYPWRAELARSIKACEGLVLGRSVSVRDMGLYIVPSKVAQKVEQLVRGVKDGKKGNAVVETLSDELYTQWSAVGAILEALVRVRITPCGRGTPETLGLLYEITNDKLEEVRGKVKQMRGGKDAELTGEGEGAEGLCEPPTKENVLGRITTGGFSLARGEGYAVGFVPLSSYLNMTKRDFEAAPHEQKLVLFRNRDGQVYRAATLELM